MAVQIKFKKGNSKKQAILDKTKGCCWYCGKKLSSNWSIDHQYPKSQGGCNDISNLVPSCVSCNSRKKDKTLEKFKIYLQQQFFIKKYKFGFRSNEDFIKFLQFCEENKIILDLPIINFPFEKCTQ
jgi:hypothetical protein